MASLNTLRTKFGIVLSIVIALALLAFILSLKTEMGFTGNDPKVGVMNGENVNYSEYYNRYEQVKAQSGMTESDEQQSAMLANATWQSLIAEKVLDPAFEQMGLFFTNEEKMAMLSGEQFSQTLYNAFADPATGLYNVEAVNQFMTEAQTNPEVRAAYSQLLEQLRLESQLQKFAGLVKGGVNINPLEAAQGVKAANETRNGKWVVKRYAQVPDSLFTVSDSEISAYYKAHKANYKQLPSRSFSYVLFEVMPTGEDLRNLENKVTQVGEEFAAAADVKAFTRANSYGSISENYLSAAQLNGEEQAALWAGKTYGPVMQNNEWTMARALDTKMAPDSIGIRHIVLPYTETALADSLMTVLRAGGDFGELAAQYSLMTQTAVNGGEVGVMPFSAFTGEFAEKLAGVKKGDLVQIAAGDAIQLMQIYRADKPSKHVKVASITYPVEASAETRRSVHSTAGTFTVNAEKGSLEAFNAAATTAAVTPRIAKLMQGERMVRGLEDSREVARWVYGAELGDVSEIFKVGDDYVVAILTGIDDEHYTAQENVAASIRQQLLRDKKYEYIVSQANGATLEEIAAGFEAEVADFTDAAYGAYYLSGPGLEPRLIGAIASTSETGKVSAPVKGMSGVFYFQVDEVKDAATQTVEAEQVRAQATQESFATQYALQAVQEMAEIEDLRGKYF